MSTRKHEFITEIAATPEEVWRMLTEAESLQKWFAPNVEVTPGEGGSIKLSWGPGCEGTAPVHSWQEGKRVGWTEGDKVVEFEIEPVSGGSTRLRLVHSGFGADAKFDQEYESTHGGWLNFLALLRHAAEQYSGVPATQIHVLSMVPMPVGEQWEWLTGPDGMGIDTLAEGQPYRASLNGWPLEGKILRQPKRGYLCLSAPDSMLGIFVEKSGATSMRTIQWTLFGEARERVEEARKALAAYA